MNLPKGSNVSTHDIKQLNFADKGESELYLYMDDREQADKKISLTNFRLHVVFEFFLQAVKVQPEKRFRQRPAGQKCATSSQ